MNNIRGLKPSTLRWISGWFALTFCVTLTTDAEEPYFFVVSEKTTLSIQFKIPESSEPKFRSTTHTDSKSAKLEAALVKLLDSNQDGVLNVSELSEAESLLERFDYDEDECLAPLELVNDLLTTRSPMTASPKIASVLVRSKDDAQGIESLRRVLERLGQPVMISLDSVDAVIESASADREGVDVHSSDGSSVQIMKFNRLSGTSRYLLIKNDLTVDLSVEQPLIESLNIDVRPARSGVFERLDIDGDSKLSRVELRAGAKSDVDQTVLTSTRPFESSVAIWFGKGRRRPVSIALLPVNSGAGCRHLETLEWFGATDHNLDGVISMNEFLAGDEKFRDLDANNDGLLTREEAERK